MMLMNNADEPHHDEGRRQLSLPSCPECQASRTLVCSFCGNYEGTFELADGNFLESIVELAMPGSSPAQTDDSEVPLTPEPTAGESGASNSLQGPSAAAQAVRPVVICPRCDEAAPAEYARDCEDCGHTFNEGRHVEWPTSDDYSAANGRVMFTIWALVAVFVGGLAYFWYVFSR